MNDFSPDELTTLRAHGIVLFAQRVIFDAQPPMTPAQLAAVQAHCAGPIPSGLLDLWRLTAGGALDYSLSARMNGSEEALSLNDLFWPGGAAPCDLMQAIEHERARHSGGSSPARQVDGKLSALPFGGFEESDRFYAVLEAGPQHGHILAWKQGLPMAWSHAMHADGVVTVATDLEGAFAALHLDEDPLAPAGDYFCGQALLDYLDERHGDHGLDLDLADRLVSWYRRAIADWRTPLAQGTLAQSPGLAQIAIRHAIATDDGALIDELAVAGVKFAAPLQGTAVPTDLALGHGAHLAAQALLDGDAPVRPDALEGIDGAVSPELVQGYLQHGARASSSAMAQCVACGAPAAARLIAQAYAQHHDDLPRAWGIAREKLLAELEAALAHSQPGEPAAGPDAGMLVERIGHLRAFEL